MAGASRRASCCCLALPSPLSDRSGMSPSHCLSGKWASRIPRRSFRDTVACSIGSIRRSTLQVLSRQRERFRVVALTAHSNGDLLAAQAKEWQPAFVGLVNGGARDSGLGIRKGSDCLVDAATHPDVRIVVNGIVGAAGLEATLAALRA